MNIASEFYLSPLNPLIYGWPGDWRSRENMRWPLWRSYVVLPIGERG
jgi:hypothetical protein